MGEYLSKYQTEEDYNNNKDNHLKPHVSLIVNPVEQIIFIPEPSYIKYSKEYFTIENTGSEDLTFQLMKSTKAQTVSYMDSESSDWVDTSKVITVAPQSELKLKGTIAPVFSYGIGTFRVSGNTTYNVKGNVMSLLYGDDFSDKTDLTGKDNAFNVLFRRNTKLVDSSNLILPATTLASKCYQYMFQDCTSLVSAPELPATTLANSCYASMFEGCTSLVSAPELPATTLANYCYDNMFEGCTSLVSAPELPATTLATYCYQYMFEGCTSLVSATELPATTLANYCYDNMFGGCSNLTTAPELPATTLADYCYYYMFSSCTSLTTAPELPATTLADYCYRYMFSNCSKLNNITMLATDISAKECLYYWVNNVSSSGTFIKHPSMTKLSTGISGIPSGWTVEDYSQSA